MRQMAGLVIGDHLIWDFGFRISDFNARASHS
jgi:hypothetical protein